MIADQNIMKKAMAKGDAKGFIDADIAFHKRLLDAAGNPFMAALFDRMSEILHPTRHQLLSQEKVRARAVEKHHSILEAMIAGDPLQVEFAMTDHMEQIEEDLETYVRDSAESTPLENTWATEGWRSSGIRILDSFRNSRFQL